MIIENLNFFSLIIPAFLIAIGLGVSCFAFLKPIPKYVTWHAIATVCIGLCILLHTVLNHAVLHSTLALVLGIFLLACCFIINAVHHRLNIQTQWKSLIGVTLIGVGSLFYFSVIHDDQDIRLILLGFTISIIFANRLITLIKYKPKQLIDHGLKITVCIIIVIASVRGVILYFLIGNGGFVSDFQNIWATTQLLLIILDLVFFALFTACAIQDLMSKLRIERNIDPLTGLLNRRALNERVHSKNEDPIRTKALLLCDLDFFKKINDTYGHAVGDEALKHVSAIMNKSIRPYDEISRIGGEEFLIILMDVNQEMALNIAERIRHAIESQPLKSNGQIIPITASIGMDFFEHKEDFDKTMQSADLLLYQAKKLGRNQVQWELKP